MKRKSWSGYAGSTLVLLLLPMLGGCTVLGFGVGWIADSASDTFENVPLDVGLRQLDIGDSVICMTNERGGIAGTYMGMGVPGNETLQELLTRERLGDCANRESVRAGDLLVMKCFGHDEETVAYATTDGNQLQYQPLEGEPIQSRAFTQIEWLTRCGGKVISPPYGQCVGEGVFERTIYMHVLAGDTIMEIDTAAIRNLHLERTPWTARTVLTLLGLAIDAAIVIGIAISF